jgi:asparagine synthetase B (glutamine-hydrolysing)
MQGREKKRAKAVGLLSGGLDSTLAAKLMLEQGIEVYAVNFTSKFMLSISPLLFAPVPRRMQVVQRL